MLLQELVTSECPYCGQAIELLIDSTVEEQSYIEDCQVCCQPMIISVAVDGSGISEVSVRTEND